MDWGNENPDLNYKVLSKFPWFLRDIGKSYWKIVQELSWKSAKGAKSSGMQNQARGIDGILFLDLSQSPCT